MLCNYHLSILKKSVKFGYQWRYKVFTLAYAFVPIKAPSEFLIEINMTDENSMKKSSYFCTVFSSFICKYYLFFIFNGTFL